MFTALKLVLFFVSATYLQGPAQPAAASRLTTLMTITVPNDGTELEIEGKAVPGTGLSRTFETPPLAAATNYQYTVVAKWAPNTYTNMTRTKVVRFRGGERVNIDLTVDDPADRVRVMYVPTPDHIAMEMVKLAGITPNDVTYEPGVGDARITIAAVKAGAKRAVGIDLDPERVAESRANVKAAGLSDKIDIRLGDALEQPDLGSMTVVLLYMGDHFNMLIRPYLWKQLPVGARVVSHRFLMGDWKPDKTISVPDEYGLSYDLHLWTITEAHKRQK
ncbi:MAG TPA: TIGR03000 domain-containing protein [Vicinamibacterales bacterium]|nr:TIGR03000 domain-containing protein [Vicinamibacterales bacterium]